MTENINGREILLPQCADECDCIPEDDGTVSGKCGYASSERQHRRNDEVFTLRELYERREDYDD